MTHSDILLSFAALAVLAFQIWVTLKVRRSNDYDAGQKSAQTKLIWLLPIIGAAVAFSVLEPEDRKDTDRKQQG